jgi:hypothetical protein
MANQVPILKRQSLKRLASTGTTMPDRQFFDDAK